MGWPLTGIPTGKRHDEYTSGREEVSKVLMKYEGADPLGKTERY